jgi:Rrf2 family protein
MRRPRQLRAMMFCRFTLEIAPIYSYYDFGHQLAPPRYDLQRLGAGMTLLNRKVDYGLLILSFLYRNPDGGCAREIAGRLGLSRAFVANILKDLCHKGFVASHRGVKGGYVTLRPAEAITLAELMDALDGSFRLAECIQEIPSDGCALVDICPIKGPVAELHQRIRDVLRATTLAELVRPACSSQDVRIGLPTLARDAAESGAVRPVASC